MGATRDVGGGRGGDEVARGVDALNDGWTLLDAQERHWLASLMEWVAARMRREWGGGGWALGKRLVGVYLSGSSLLRNL